MVALSQAVRGMDVDRLFLGLRRIAVEAGIQLPDFFHDKSMLLPSLKKLDTSQVGVHRTPRLTDLTSSSQTLALTHKEVFQL